MDSFYSDPFQIHIYNSHKRTSNPELFICVLTEPKILALYNLCFSVSKLSQVCHFHVVVRSSKKDIYLSFINSLFNILSDVGAYRLTFSVCPIDHKLSSQVFLDQIFKSSTLNSLPLLSQLGGIKTICFGSSLEMIRYFDRDEKLSKPKIGLVVHARMSSTRLPGKALLPINGVPVVESILQRLQAFFPQYYICLSTGNSHHDDTLYDYIDSKGFDVYRGTEENLSLRLLEIIKANELDIVVRVTGDDLFRDLHSIQRLISSLVLITIISFLMIFPGMQLK